MNSLLLWTLVVSICIAILHVQASEVDQCCCFPASPVFERQLRASDKVDTYVLEKAMPTLRTWLASQCKSSYAMVPFYAYYDVLHNLVDQDDMETEHATILYTVMKQAEAMHVVSIQDALDSVAVCVVGACPLYDKEL